MSAPSQPQRKLSRTKLSFPVRKAISLPVSDSISLKRAIVLLNLEKSKVASLMATTRSSEARALRESSPSSIPPRASCSWNSMRSMSPASAISAW